MYFLFVYLEGSDGGLNAYAFKSSEFARECGNALLSAFHNQRDCVCFFSGNTHSADYNICKIAQNFLHFDCNRLVASKHDSDYAYSFHNYLFCAVARLYLCKAQVIFSSYACSEHFTTPNTNKLCKSAYRVQVSLSPLIKTSPFLTCFPHRRSPSA